LGLVFVFGVVLARRWWQIEHAVLSLIMKTHRAKVALHLILRVARHCTGVMRLHPKRAMPAKLCFLQEWRLLITHGLRS
jgi:hypothetical protein